MSDELKDNLLFTGLVVGLSSIAGTVALAIYWACG